MSPSELTLISGGQSGADLGGLLAARAAGCSTGGWMPRGFKTEDGPHPEYALQFGMKEMESANYTIRTRVNVKSSDVTLIFARDFQSVGTLLTIRECQRLDKHFAKIDMNAPIPQTILLDWLVRRQPKVINVAGNRESKAPGLQSFVRDYLTEVLKEYVNEGFPRSDA
jgi:hypothetical protein